MISTMPPAPRRHLNVSSGLRHARLRCFRFRQNVTYLSPACLHVLSADGTVWALDPNAPIADLQPFLTITGAKSHDRDQFLGPHKVD
jgi:hypothetical protein